MKEALNKNSIGKIAMILLTSALILAVGVAAGYFVSETANSEKDNVIVENVYPKMDDRVLAFSESEFVSKDGQQYEYVKNYYLCDGYDLAVDKRIANKESLEVHTDERLGKGIKYGNCFLGERMIAQLIGADAVNVQDLRIYDGNSCSSCWNGFTYIVDRYDNGEVSMIEYGFYNLEWNKLVGSQQFNSKLQVKFTAADSTSALAVNHEDICTPLATECVYSADGGSGIYDLRLSTDESLVYEIVRVSDYVEMIDQAMVEDSENWPLIEP